MSSYRLVSSDYPTSTYTMIQAINNDSKVAKTESFDMQLPLPNQLVYDSPVDWSSDEVSLLTTSMVDASSSVIKNVSGTIRSSAERGDSPSDVLINSLNNLTEMNIDENTKKTFFAGGLKSIAERGLGKVNNTTGANLNETDIKYILSKVGVTYNPNRQLFFNGAAHREFTLSFDIVPQNANHAQSAASAIKKLRVLSSPSYAVGKAFFTYPSYFSLNVIVLGTEIIRRPSFAIRNILTNLTPNGVMSWHSDGKPVSYTLEIQCIETSVVDSKEEESRPFIGA